jgi:hypothetical protein
MIQILKEKWQGIDGLHRMRSGLIDQLEASDLKFSPGGQNPPLKRLFADIAASEQSYTYSITNLKESDTHQLGGSPAFSDIPGLRQTFAELDAALEQAIARVGDEQLSLPVKRTNGHTVSLEQQIDIYMQAVFIYLGKLVVYYLAMDRDLPPSVKRYIA